MQPVVLHLPDDFHVRLRACARATGSGSVANLITRLLVSHVATHECMQAMQEFADMEPPAKALKPPSTSSPWLGSDSSWFGKGGRR
jgi:hypothetical protein